MMSPLALAAALLLTAAPGAPGGAAPEAQAHWTIQTSDPQVQALFDRGLMMLYAFDVGEARSRSAPR